MPLASAVGSGSEGTSLLTTVERLYLMTSTRRVRFKVSSFRLWQALDCQSIISVTTFRMMRRGGFQHPCDARRR
jgi:hypothetical protein